MRIAAAMDLLPGHTKRNGAPNWSSVARALALNGITDADGEPLPGQRVKRAVASARLTARQAERRARLDAAERAAAL